MCVMIPPAASASGSAAALAYAGASTQSIAAKPPENLRELAKGFPGSKLFRRRGAEEIRSEEEADRSEA